MKISFTINITRKTILVVVAISVIGIAAAATTLFTHTFPGVKTVPPPPFLVTQCSTLTNETTPVLGSSGNMTFDCGSGRPAFNTTAAIPKPAGGPVTPTFTLTGTGYSRVAIWAAFLYGAFNTNPPCVGPTYQVLVSGQAIIFATGGAEYIYCAEFNSAPATGFAPFSVAWNQ